MENTIVGWLPVPQQWEFTENRYVITENSHMVLPPRPEPRVIQAVQRVQQALRQYAAVECALAAGYARKEEKPIILWEISREKVKHPQGYRLCISQEGIQIQAYMPAGLFYAACTLVQLIRRYGAQIPCMRVTDWPDYPTRGVMLDISRGKVPTLQTLFELVDWLAGLKINQLQLYMEHTFAYRSHPIPGADASPFTGEDILKLDAYCHERFIELVPSQNSFGHLTQWLKHDEYIGLAEAPEGFRWPWGEKYPDPWSLDPFHPGSIGLLESLYDELLPHFGSRLFNICGDEPLDLDQGKHCELVAEIGKQHVYLDFIMKIYRLVCDRGATMMFWGDIINEKPELIPALPKDCIALEWGYAANHPFDEHCAGYAAAGIPFYVCPGVSTWATIAGKTDNAMNNIDNAARSGLKYGAIGLLNTSWGDLGHWDPLPVAYLGFAYGAAVSWAIKADQRKDFTCALSLHAFDDPSGAFGEMAYSLGNVYQACGGKLRNPLWRLLWEGVRGEPHASLEPGTSYQEIGVQGFQRTRAAIDSAMKGLENTAIRHRDGLLIRREFTWASKVLYHACSLGELQLDMDAGIEGTKIKANKLAAELKSIMAEFREIWLARNRIGGLEEISMSGWRRLWNSYKKYTGS